MVPRVLWLKTHPRQCLLTKGIEGATSRANVSTDQEYPGTDGLASEQTSLINASRHRSPNLITEAI
jgi:hypothetical protein